MAKSVSAHRFSRACVLASAMMLGGLACGPGPRSEPVPNSVTGSGGLAAQKKLVIAMRAEPPSIASKPLVQFTRALLPPVFLFNASLDYQDELEVPKPYLAEALPQLDTETWQVFPDGRMETRYRLRPDLTWQDGVQLSSEDFVFAWRVYLVPNWGVASSPPIGMMEEVVAPDSRTLIIRWRQPYPDAGVMTDGWAVGFQALPRHVLGKPFEELEPTAFAGLPFWTSEYTSQRGR